MYPGVGFCLFVLCTQIPFFFGGGGGGVGNGGRVEQRVLLVGLEGKKQLLNLVL